jgi:hypothetical protein
MIMFAPSPEPSVVDAPESNWLLNGADSVMKSSGLLPVCL